MAQRAAYHFDVGPVIEQLLNIFKMLGLVSLGDVDGPRAGDMDVVGMQDVRNGREAHLSVRVSEATGEFELLFSHWGERDERVE